MDKAIKAEMREVAERIAARAGVTVGEVVRVYRKACKGGAVNMATLFMGVK